MTNVRSGQVAVVAASTAAPKLQIGQLSTISVLVETPPNIRFNQIAVIQVITGNINRAIMGPLFRLPCWQPCTAFGTRALIVDFSKIRKAL